MSEILTRYRSLADDLAARIAAVPAQAWENPSPCEDWTAREVMAHVIGNARAVVDRLNGAEHHTLPAVDVAAEWAAARAGVEAVLADPERAGASVDGPFGPMPFEQLIGRFACMDILIHTWDLARATGGDERVDAAAAAAALEGLRPMDAMIRQAGVFGPKTTAPAGADVVTELMAFCGRKV
ncbi:MAG: TIGR03086 family metal-binding protein [Sporichthyaceae bacterium]